MHKQLWSCQILWDFNLTMKCNDTSGLTIKHHPSKHLDLHFLPRSLGSMYYYAANKRKKELNHVRETMEQRKVLQTVKTLIRLLLEIRVCTVCPYSFIREVWYIAASKRKKELNHVRTILRETMEQRKVLQTVKTQIRLLLEEQSDLGLHCLPISICLKSLVYCS